MCFAMDFNDIDASHWAYTNVQTLVNDGTVSGYGDGSFRPNGTVTRAEFVKMLGLGSVTRPMAYADVAPQHWAYTYVMNADFPMTEAISSSPTFPSPVVSLQSFYGIVAAKKRVHSFLPSSHHSIRDAPKRLHGYILPV